MNCLLQEVLITRLGHKTDIALARILLIELNVDTNHMGMIPCMYFNDSAYLHKIFNKENLNK